MSHKRPRPVTTTATTGPDASKKRRKLDTRAKQKGQKPNSTTGAGVATGKDAKLVRGDALKWQEIRLPERLDDAEGFYGLEEIEGVEVVRDARELGHGGVGFRVVDAGDGGMAAGRDPSVVSEGDWDGFSDDGTEGDGPDRSSRTNGKSRTEDGVKGDKHRSKRVERSLTQTEADLDTDTQFDLLNEMRGNTDTDISAWVGLGLTKDMLGAISNLGFARPTPIQTSVIPSIREGHDVIGKAVTGSGKTLAFGIPILETWLALPRQTSNSTPVALILAPTRELAHQLTKHLSTLGEGLTSAPRIATVTGGLSVLKQRRQLEHADLVIGTPGRLWEVISEDDDLISKLRQIQFLVVDEADRLLSGGHFQEVEEIFDALDREVVEEDDRPQQVARQKRQTLVFSATFNKGLQQKLTSKKKHGADDGLSTHQSMEYVLKKLNFREEKPIFIDSNPTSQMAATLQETIVECGAMEKDVYLYTVALQNPQARILVFTNSISSVRRLTPMLSNLELPAVALHSTMPQKARLRSLERFSAQRSILVATDVAARGLDIKGIDLIVHYHAPRTADMYIHRSGRTARAENAGRSVLLCSPDEVAGVKKLTRGILGDRAPNLVQIDREIIKRLGPRISLSKGITEATLAKEKNGSQDEWLRTAAEELGVDYDSEEFAAEGAKHGRGRGAGRSKKQKESGAVTKAELAGMRAELKDLLSKRVNLGISERYLAGGKVDVDALLEGESDGVFLGGRIMGSG